MHALLFHGERVTNTLAQVNFRVGEHHRRTDEILPDNALEQFEKFDSMFLGAIGHPDVKPGILEVGILLKTRFALGIYTGVGGVTQKGTSQEVATQVMQYTRPAVERCVKYAYELTRRRNSYHQPK